jgi:CheY-like chemotaxis protein
MNILLIEDDPCFGRLIKEWSERHGHTVTWIVGVKAVNGKAAVGMSPKGAYQNYTFAGKTTATWFWNPEDVTVDLSKFDLAFVDGQPEKGSLLGPEIVSLIGEIIHCMGVSSFASINDKMVSAGAIYVITKPDLLVVIVGEMPISKMDFTDPALQAEMAEFAKDHFRDGALLEKFEAALHA